MIDAYQINTDNDYQNRSIHSLRRDRCIQIAFDFTITSVIFSIFAFVYFFVNPKIRHFTCDESDIFLPFKGNLS